MIFALVFAHGNKVDKQHHRDGSNSQVLNEECPALQHLFSG